MPDGHWERLHRLRTRIGMLRWLPLAVVVAAGVTTVLYIVCIVWWQPYLENHDAGRTSPMQLTPSPASQHLADGLATAQGVAPAIVMVERDPGFFARSHCEPAPAGSAAKKGVCTITLSEAADHASTDRPDLVLPMMGHEYGHIALWRADSHPGYILLYSPYLAMLVLEFTAGLLWLRKDWIWPLPVLGLAFGAVWYYVNSRSDSSPMAFLAGCGAGGMFLAFLFDDGLRGLTWRHAVAAFGIGATLVATFIIGVNLRNAPFRAVESGNDRLAVKLTDAAAVGRLFCVLQAQENTQIQETHKAPIDVYWMHWMDVHPVYEARAQALGFTLSCPANVSVPGASAAAIGFNH